MREILREIERWEREGRRVAVATVVEVWGSAPRQPGSRMAVSSAREVCGSVSGGCVEGAVIEEAQELLRGGGPRLLRYGVSRETAWSVGLSCGGTLEVFLERHGEPGGADVARELRRAVVEERLVALATVIAGPGCGRRMLVRPDATAVGGLGHADVDRAAREAARGHLERFSAGRVRCTPDGAEVDVFVEALAPRPVLVVVGAGHIAIPLVHFARLLGMRTAVADPRAVFATPERFGHADELIVDWPGPAFERIGLGPASCVAVLAHDPKLDVAALELAARSPARYVGALGSRRTHERRVAALREAGLSEAEIARIRSPIGLDLGGRRPEEIALAIIAEVVAAGHGSRR